MITLPAPSALRLPPHSSLSPPSLLHPGLTIELHGCVLELVCDACAAVRAATAPDTAAFRAASRDPARRGPACEQPGCQGLLRTKIMLYDDADEDLIIDDSCLDTLADDLVRPPIRLDALPSLPSPPAGGPSLNNSSQARAARLRASVPHTTRRPRPCAGRRGPRRVVGHLLRAERLRGALPQGPPRPPGGGPRQRAPGALLPRELAARPPAAPRGANSDPPERTGAAERALASGSF